MNEFEFVTWLKDHVSTNPFGALGETKSILKIIENLNSVEVSKSKCQLEGTEKTDVKNHIFPLYSLIQPLSKDDPAIFVQLPPGDVIDRLFMRILVPSQDLGCLESNALVTSDTSQWFEIPKPQSWVVTIDHTKIPKHKYLSVPFQGPFALDLGYTRKYMAVD